MAFYIHSMNLAIQFAPFELRQPKLDEVRRDAIPALGIAAPDDAASDILAKLQLELRLDHVIP